MYPLDFEEYLIANGMNTEALEVLKKKCLERETLDEQTHAYLLQLFRKYLVTGGLPEAVDNFIRNINVVKLRRIQRDIHELYKIDCSKYDSEKKLVIRKVYDLIPSLTENKKKRIVVKDIENRKGRQFTDYEQEFEYLISAGVALEVRAVSNPKFPITESETKNLLKLYLNDVGLLSYLLYNINVNSILDDVASVNLGIYSGKDYKVHSAPDNFMKTADYHIRKSLVPSNERRVFEENGVVYMPVYYIAFILPDMV